MPELYNLRRMQDLQKLYDLIGDGSRLRTEIAGGRNNAERGLEFLNGGESCRSEILRLVSG